MFIEHHDPVCPRVSCEGKVTTCTYCGAPAVANAVHQERLPHWHEHLCAAHVAPGAR